MSSFTDTYSYELKNRSVMKKTLYISLAIHIILGIIFFVIPFQPSSPAKEVSLERNAIKIMPVSPAQEVVVQEVSNPLPIVSDFTPITATTSPVARQQKTADHNIAQTSIPATSSTSTIASSAPAKTFNVNNIRSLFISALERNKEYPYIARRQNQTGVVGMAISLDASGGLQHVSVTSSSGYSQLDNAALTLVRKICPFAHDAGQTVSFNVSISYDLEG
ncbi:TonB family protein [Selenomonadales bacterium OttesenSCG-928-I06]|nr:TonB family protein [Selenomonadales bacterium OttesenSCG-928-I06]